MSTIHLRMVKLKGYRQILPEQLLFVSAPNDKWVIRNTAVHTDCSILTTAGFKFRPLVFSQYYHKANAVLSCV